MYRSKQKEYKRLIRISKSASYKDFCGKIEALSETSRLVKVLKKDKPIRLETLRKPDGTYTESKTETLSLMFETHFPGNQITIGSQPELLPGTDEEPLKITRQGWYVASIVPTDEAIKCAVVTFDSFKSPGTDGIYPALLQKGVDPLLLVLKRILIASLTLAYIPTTWRSVCVAFIPKIGKGDYSLAKLLSRLINLTYFLLKRLERLVELHVRKTALQIHPLSQMQRAYQRGKFCETALQNLVGRVECALDRKEYALGIFIERVLLTMRLSTACVTRPENTA